MGKKYTFLGQNKFNSFCIAEISTVFMSMLCAVFRYSSFHKEFAQLEVTCLFEALRYPEYCLSVLTLTTVFVYCTSVYILEMLEDSSSHDKCIILDRLEDKQSISAQC